MMKITCNQEESGSGRKRGCPKDSKVQFSPGDRTIGKLFCRSVPGSPRTKPGSNREKQCNETSGDPRLPQIPPGKQKLDQERKTITFFERFREFSAETDAERKAEKHSRIQKSGIMSGQRTGTKQKKKDQESEKGIAENREPETCAGGIC